MISAPPSSRARTNWCVASSDGSPAVMYATIPTSPAERSCAKRLEIRVALMDEGGIRCPLRLKQALIGVHVLVAAAGEIEDDEVGGFELWDSLNEACYRVG